MAYVFKHLSNMSSQSSTMPSFPPVTKPWSVKAAQETEDRISEQRVNCFTSYKSNETVLSENILTIYNLTLFYFFNNKLQITNWIHSLDANMTSSHLSQYPNGRKLHSGYTHTCCFSTKSHVRVWSRFDFDSVWNNNDFILFKTGVYDDVTTLSREHMANTGPSWALMVLMSVVSLQM